MKDNSLIDKIEILQKECIDLATGQGTYDNYELARKNLLEFPAVSNKFPKWLKDCRSGSQFWGFIKPKIKTYQERREFLWDEFRPLLEYAERSGLGPTAASVDEVLTSFTSESIQDAWHRCFERRQHDPEGAITSSRSLLESTCKHILDEQNITYNPNEELPKLYKLAANSLNLSPDQHNEQIFKQILGGCGSVVEGLGALRNKLGDAHGKGARKIKPSRRHAELAVNLAGSVCSFLISTFEEKSGN